MRYPHLIQSLNKEYYGPSQTPTQFPLDDGERPPTPIQFPADIDDRSPTVEEVEEDASLQLQPKSKKLKCDYIATTSFEETQDNHAVIQGSLASEDVNTYSRNPQAEGDQQRLITCFEAIYKSFGWHHALDDTLINVVEN